MSINEKLAVEVMGWHWDDEKNLWRNSDGYGTLDGLEDDEEGVFIQDPWNPIEDLNQLKMCYEAAEKGWPEPHRYSFAFIFFECLYNLLGEPKGDWVLTEVWVKNPELVAQAILKAKGVS